ncbi:hypothetical protein [Chroococcidiopsis sp.]|uniref:hypothetical protein n=1 Tax=Chroococcidiopsis sp. TaxID=3088168 RepID=UPI003F307EFC
MSGDEDGKDGDIINEGCKDFLQSLILSHARQNKAKRITVSSNVYRNGWRSPIDR